MSETQEAEQEVQEAALQAAQQAAETQETEQQAAEGAAPAEGQEPAAKPEEKPDPARRNAAHLRARVTEANRRAAEMEAENHRLREMLAAQGKDPGEPDADKPLTQAQIEARAEQLLAERLMATERVKIIQAGVKEYGREMWDERTETLLAMGALARPEFMEALVDLPNAHQVIIALADDPDQLSALLAKRPAAMAATMGRIAAGLTVTEQQPKPEISRVPAPVRPVTHGRVAPAPDPAKMSAREYIEYRNRTAPKHLGGEGKAA